MSLSRNLIAALLIAALLPCSVQAKTNLSDWGNVQRLKIGAKIVVSTKRGDRFAGELKHVDTDSLVLLVRVRDVMRQAIDLRREDVAEVRKPKSRYLPLLLGAGIGVGVGVGIGAISDARHPYGDDPGLGKVLFGFLGGLMGVAGGGAIPMKGKKIYIAP
jgi:hypothetical protein